MKKQGTISSTSQIVGTLQAERSPSNTTSVEVSKVQQFTQSAAQANLGRPFTEQELAVVTNVASVPVASSAQSATLPLQQISDAVLAKAAEQLGRPLTAEETTKISAGMNTLLTNDAIAQYKQNNPIPGGTTPIEDAITKAFLGAAEKACANDPITVKIEPAQREAIKVHVVKQLNTPEAAAYCKQLGDKIIADYQAQNPNEEITPQKQAEIHQAVKNAYIDASTDALIRQAAQKQARGGGALTKEEIQTGGQKQNLEFAKDFAEKLNESAGHILGKAAKTILKPIVENVVSWAVQALVVALLDVIEEAIASALGVSIGEIVGDAIGACCAGVGVLIGCWLGPIVGEAIATALVGALGSVVNEAVIAKPIAKIAAKIAGKIVDVGVDVVEDVGVKVADKASSVMIDASGKIMEQGSVVLTKTITQATQAATEETQTSSEQTITISDNHESKKPPSRTYEQIGKKVANEERRSTHQRTTLEKSEPDRSHLKK